nr:MAG TPA: hypothetical protein [Caudoviricetes sp.]DAY28307.1 MAG TPA: hypothetical protein [Caudoviricetes sp.]
MRSEIFKSGGVLPSRPEKSKYKGVKNGGN